MRSRGCRWWDRLPVQLGLLTVLAVVAAAIPTTRFWLLIVTNWTASVLVLNGLRRFRPALRRSWAVAAAFLALVAAGNTVLLWVGPDSAMVMVLTASAQFAAAGAVPGLFKGTPHTRLSQLSGREAWGRGLDLLVLVLVAGLGAAALFAVGVAHHRSSGLSWPLALAPVADVMLLAVLVWTALSRSQLVPAMVVLLAAGFLCLAFDLTVTASGHRVASPGQPLEVLGVINMSLFGIAAQRPSMVLLGRTGAPTRPRRSWVQLLLLAPCVLAPAAATVTVAAGAPSPLPLPVVAGVSVAVVLAVLTRAALALHGVEASAERDALTGLLNRRGLARAFTAFTAFTATPTTPGRSGRTWWLLLIDLDDFKTVNDRYGHRTGDVLLRAVADRLTAAVAEHDGLVARHGGDEFIVALTTAGSPPDASYDSFDAQPVDPADVVRRALAEPVDLAVLSLVVSASVGVLPLDDHLGDRHRGPETPDNDPRVGFPGGRGLDDLLADADIAMYAAKRSAKGTSVVFHPQLRETLLARLAAVEDLHTLLDPTPEDPCDHFPDGAGQLEVYYQPIVDLTDGHLVGAEALVRWKHPVRGLVRPDEFLVLVEREGLGVRLDQLVLDAALAQLQRWDRHLDQQRIGRAPAGAAPLFLSINLGLASMCDPTLATWVTQTAAAHDIAPQRIHLEITEHDELPDEEHITTALHELVGAGFALSLDDFGIGYTSLSYLARYPISTLKLDRSLIAEEGASAQPLIAAITALARSLDLTVLAEGIEDAAQAQDLDRVGVHLAQGYHFGRPLPVEEFTAALQGRGADSDRHHGSVSVLSAPLRREEAVSTRV